MRRYAITCALFLLAAPALAQDARTWIFDDNPELPVLMFGTPDTDEIVFSVACDPREKKMTIVESVASKKMSPGGTATFKLTAGTVTLDLTGDAVASESDGTISIEVIGPPNPRLFALLKGGPSLTIEIPGAKETISLAAAAPHVANLEKLCAGKR